MDDELKRVRFGKELNAFRKNKSLTIQDIAKSSGLSVESLEKIEQGKVDIPDLAMLSQLSKAMDDSSNEILKASGKLESIGLNIVDIDSRVELPVINNLVNGELVINRFTIVGHVGVFSQELPNGTNFGYQVSNNDMSPFINSNDIVIVHKQSSIRDSEVALISSNGKLLIRRFKNELLITDNNQLNAINIDDDKVMIIGKVMQKVVNLK